MPVATTHDKDMAQDITSHAGQSARWAAVLAMSLCTFTLIASEFMPVSLLTPLAADLGISQGQAGQGIAISGVFAVLTSLFIFSLIGRMDRRFFLLVMTSVMILSGLVVSLAPDYISFMIGRALIGGVVGGFWSISVSVVMRLVPSEQVSRAMAILNGGNALATIIAAPLGSFLGEIIGWRGAFFTIVPIALTVLIWQWLSLPAMPARQTRDIWQAFRLLRSPLVLSGMAAIGCFFMGQFALFTYVRPFLEQVTNIQVPVLSWVLLLIGISGLIGTSVIGFILKGSGLFKTMIFLPITMALIATGLILFGNSASITTGLLGFWGLIGTAAPVCYWTWLARNLAQEAEPGGGLMVAVIQAAITLGAASGGLLFDLFGYPSTFGLATILLIASALFALLTAHIARERKN